MGGRECDTKRYEKKRIIMYNVKEVRKDTKGPECGVRRLGKILEDSNEILGATRVMEGLECCARRYNQTRKDVVTVRVDTKRYKRSCI